MADILETIQQYKDEIESIKINDKDIESLNEKTSILCNLQVIDNELLLDINPEALLMRLDRTKDSINKLRNNAMLKSRYILLGRLLSSKNLTIVLNSQYADLFKYINNSYIGSEDAILHYRLLSRGVIKQLEVYGVEKHYENDDYIDIINEKLNTKYTKAMIKCLFSIILYEVTKLENEDLLKDVIDRKLKEYESAPKYYIEIIKTVGDKLYKIVACIGQEIVRFTYNPEWYRHNTWPWANIKSILKVNLNEFRFNINTLNKLRLLNVDDYEGIPTIHSVMIDILREYINII